MELISTIRFRTPLVGRYGGGELDFGVDQLSPEERSHYFLSAMDSFISVAKKRVTFTV